MRIARMLNANVKVWQMVAAMVVTSFALAGLATANYTSTPPETSPPPVTQKMITACAHKHSGDLRLLMDRKRGHGEKGEKKARSSNNGGQKPLACRKNEKTLRWAVEGPAGPTGVTGPVGSTGETGATGPTA